MQSEVAPPDVCFSSLEVTADEKWNSSNESSATESPDLNTGNVVESINNVYSPSGIDFIGDQSEGTVGGLPDLCSSVDLSQYPDDEYSTMHECGNSLSEKENCDRTDELVIPKEHNYCERDTYMQLSSKKINIISCATGVITSNFEFCTNSLDEMTCDNNCPISATPSTKCDIGILRQNIVQSSDPNFLLWENMVAVPNQLLGTVLIHSHGTSLGYLASPHYGFQVSPRHSSLYDPEPDITDKNKIKLAKRYGLIHHLPCGIFDGSTKTTECVICMIDFSEGEQLRYLPCMHTYHMECIDSWLMRSFTCPSCLEPVDAALLSTYETS